MLLIETGDIEDNDPDKEEKAERLEVSEEKRLARSVEPGTDEEREPERENEEEKVAQKEDDRFPAVQRFH